MAFQKYIPNTHSSVEPQARLGKSQLTFNRSSSEFLKDWDEIDIAVDDKPGLIAISKAKVKGEGLKVSRHDGGYITVGSTGFVNYFKIERLIKSKFKIKYENNMLLLTPISKLVS
jgi:hypothetical protein